MSAWDWDPDTYLAEMLAEIPGYEELQEAVAAATVRPSLRMTDLRLTREASTTSSTRRPASLSSASASSTT